MASFQHISGSIVWGSTFLTDAEVQAQLDLAQREHDACLRIGDRLGARVARSLYLDITDALKARDEARRSAKPFYYQSGGDVVCAAERNKGMSRDDVEAMTGLHRDEAKAAKRAGDTAAHAHATELHRQIFTATFEARRWLRASVSPSNTEWKEAS